MIIVIDVVLPILRHADPASVGGDGLLQGGLAAARRRAGQHASHVSSGGVLRPSDVFVFRILRGSLRRAKEADVSICTQSPWTAA